MSHLIACEQDNTPQTIIPWLHVVFVSHTMCQPRTPSYMHILPIKKVTDRSKGT